MYLEEVKGKEVRSATSPEGDGRRNEKVALYDARKITVTQEEGKKRDKVERDVKRKQNVDLDA